MVDTAEVLGGVLVLGGVAAAFPVVVLAGASAGAGRLVAARARVRHVAPGVSSVEQIARERQTEAEAHDSDQHEEHRIAAAEIELREDLSLESLALPGQR